MRSFGERIPKQLFDSSRLSLAYKAGTAFLKAGAH